MTPKMIASDGTYAIISPVRELFQDSELVLEDWHLYHNVARNVAAFSRRRNCIYPVTVMKRYTDLPINRSTQVLLYHTTDFVQNKNFDPQHVLGVEYHWGGVNNSAAV